MGDPERDSKYTLSVLANNISNLFETASLSFLSSLLLSGPNSPLYQNLIDTNIGQSYSPCTGYEPHSKQATFGMGLQGISPNDIPQVRSIIQDTLKEASEKGFDPVRIESLLHQTELSAKHVINNLNSFLKKNN